LVLIEDLRTIVFQTTNPVEVFIIRGVFRTGIANVAQAVGVRVLYTAITGVTQTIAIQVLLTEILSEDAIVITIQDLPVGTGLISNQP